MDPRDKIRYVELRVGPLRIQGRESKVHNWTIVIGLVVCMAAGFVTVTTETLVERKQQVVRMIRNARTRSGRRNENEITPCTYQ